MKKLRGRWSPTPEQIELVIDCATAKVPLEKAAEIVGVRPRTVWLFGKRIGKPFAAPAGRSGAGRGRGKGKISKEPESGSLHPETKHGGAPGNSGVARGKRPIKDTESGSLSFIDATAKATGKGKTTVSLDAGRGKGKAKDPESGSLGVRGKICGRLNEHP